MHKNVIMDKYVKSLRTEIEREFRKYFIVTNESVYRTFCKATSKNP